jgi:hypothetical protein
VAHNPVTLLRDSLSVSRIESQTFLLVLWNEKCIRQCRNSRSLRYREWQNHAALRRVNEIIDRLAFDVTGEVSMAFIRLRTFKATADVVSGILNWVCPECGGRMGGRGKEFKCQGECQMDWRQVWERVRTVGH